MALRRTCLAAAVLLALPAVPAAALPPGDAQRGQAIYERCQACHSLARNRSGPRHCGLLGREAASVAGFSYSRALRESGIVWTAASLDRFLANPFKAVPGTRMGYAGVKDPQERADLIAFLAAAGPCPE
ncbi:c-type cytochrome [Pelagibius marinus]|uniref:c-type cytochrome n=1 Tax=Pelagibius marinus TaxID=2762760 RepID=UPI001872DF5E|nr:cytochrome c family protein [Pelagibius marinus]